MLSAHCALIADIHHGGDGGRPLSRGLLASVAPLVIGVLLFRLAFVDWRDPMRNCKQVQGSPSVSSTANERFRFSSNAAADIAEIRAGSRLQACFPA
jgi:hypothetical protein